MGEQISKVVNVTIHYPGGVPTFADFIAGKVKSVDVQVEVMPVSANLVGDYTNDPEFRVRFQSELNALWQAKDAQLVELADKK